MSNLQQNATRRNIAPKTAEPLRGLETVLRSFVRAEVEASAPLAASRWARLVDLPEPDLARRWIASGLLPSCKPSKHTLVDRAVFDRLCLEHTKAKQAPPSTDADDELDVAILGGRS